jgi:hypothetical protein
MTPRQEFEPTVKEAFREVLLKSDQHNNTSYMEPDLGAWRQQVENILTAFDTAVGEIIGSDEAYNDIEHSYAVAYGGNYSDGNMKNHRNNLRQEQRTRAGLRKETTDAK